jgi:murein L,D-transpeptidase YafK
MTRHLRLFLLLLALSCLAVAFHRFGRTLWGPSVAKMRGVETIATVLAKTTAKGLGLSTAEARWVRGLTLIALKKERLVEVWGLDGAGRKERLRSFRFFGYSGDLGPKLREGDGQIPEGVYRIEYLNPNSSYHLSLKIDYPNAFDREKGKADGRDRLGFDIFLHGNSLTVGCIPIGDEAIEDLFTLVAQVGPDRVDVIIAPWDFRARADEPVVSAIEWESELYRIVRDAMVPFPAALTSPAL